MQRAAPCESVKQTDQVWCSSSSTGLLTLELELFGQFLELAHAVCAAFRGTVVAVLRMRSRRDG